MKKITRKQEKLTKEQEKYLKTFAQKRIKRYLSTKQYVSDKTLKTYVANAYKVAGLKAPKRVKFFKSPEAAIEHWASVRDSVWASVRASVGASVRASVRDSVGASVRASVGASVRASVRDSVWDSVRASVRDSVWASVWASVRASVRDSVWDSVRDSVRSYDDANYLSFYRLFNDLFEKNNLLWLHCLSENVTGYFLFEKECWLVRKPTILEQDLAGRLHNTKDAAIKWSDGTGYYFMNGTRVSKKIATQPEKLTKRDFSKEINAEVRRIIVEQLGDNAFKKLGAKKIDTFEKGKLESEKYTLYGLDMGSSDPDGTHKYLRMKDTSTPRVYWIPVHPDLNEARAALLWYLNLEELPVFEKET